MRTRSRVSHAPLRSPASVLVADWDIAPCFSFFADLLAANLL